MEGFDLARRLAGEALGTAFLVAAVIGSGIMADRLSGGNDALALLCNTLASGAILVVSSPSLRPSPAPISIRRSAW
jgi:glycerol uptake facilitator-like aquaporin